MDLALSPARTEVAASQAWHARLELDYERRGARTVLVRNRHTGPLVVQKSLYPEGDAPCQNVIVHPPGGIAGGDVLHMELSAGPASSVQLITPGATKWYRTASLPASQRIHIHVAADAIVEWLPHEAVVFNGAHAKISSLVELERGARYLGWDIVCLGRTASGERFTRGRFEQQAEIRCCDRLVWAERAMLAGDAPLLGSMLGLRDHPVFGTFVAAGMQVDDEALARCRRVTAQSGQGATTRLPDVMLARFRGSSTAAAREYFIALWRVLRPLAIGCAPRLPRIWNT